MRVKVCGITNREDALVAVEAGAHALGFVFAPSPRRVSPEAAAEIIAALPPFVQTVGVVVDQDVAALLARCRLDAVQFHGDEPPDALARVTGVRRIKAFRVADRADLESLAAYSAVADSFLLDARVPGLAGGTGQTFPWPLAQEARRFGRPIILAGGLTPENVCDAIAAGCPDAVDVSSQVELSPGRKDSERVRRFVTAALDLYPRTDAVSLPDPGSAGVPPAGVPAHSVGDGRDASAPSGATSDAAPGVGTSTGPTGEDR